MTNECSGCGAVNGFAAHSKCSVCHGYGAPTPGFVVTVPDDLVPAMETAMIAEDAKYAHPVYEAVGGLRYAPEEVQRQWREGFDANVDEIRRLEDEEWMRVVQEKFGLPPIPHVKPKVIVREIDHSSVYNAIDGVEADTGILLINQVQPSRNGVYRIGTVARAKADEIKRYAPFRSRVGNAVPVNKSKTLNRKKAKAAKAARKAQR